MKHSWYFIRLAFMAIPWNRRHSKAPKGTLFKRSYLVQAKNIQSAFKKADYLLSLSEHLDDGGKLNYKRVVYKKIGILNVEPVNESLESGCEIFEESEKKANYSKIKKQLISPSIRRRMITYESKNGKLPMIPKIVGDEFDRL